MLNSDNLTFVLVNIEIVVVEIRKETAEQNS